MTNAPPATRPPGTLAPGGLIVLGVWFGLVAGAVEVGLLALRHVQTPILELSRDYGWMTPAELAAITGVVGVAFALLARLGPARFATRATLFFSLVVVTLEFLLYVPGLHPAAAAALAIGIAVQATRVLDRRIEGLARVAGRTTPWLVIALVVVGAGRRVLALVTERRAIAGLPGAPGGAPNVILVTLDAVRAASLDLYGYDRATTPNLTRFAARGAVFDRAMSAASWTLPSHGSIFTGRWHHELSADYTRPLDRTYPTLAEFLAVRGYATAGIVANLRYCGYETGLDRGFLHYEDYPVSLGQFGSSTTVVRAVLNNFRLRRLLRTDQQVPRKSAADLNRAALDWIGGIEGRPFFLFLNYFDAHEPYLPPAPYDTKFGPGRRQGRISPLRRWLWDPAGSHVELDSSQRQEEVDAYDGSIAYLDSELGRFLDALERSGRLANTLVVVTADHGEEFGEHRVYEHGYSLYRRSVDVPLVFVGPGVARGRIAAPVSLRDLAATIVDLAGVRAGAPFPGASLARHWRPGADTGPALPILSQVNRVGGHPDWFPTSRGGLRAVTLRGLRYIRGGAGSEELFDFAHDSAERTNLVADPARRAALDSLRAIASSMVAPGSVPQ